MSKEASNSFFELGKKWFFDLFEAKARQGISSKTPQFVHLRRMMYKKYVPKVYLEISYMMKSTKEITTLRDLESTPLSRFPPNEYKKLYEIAYVKVGEKK